MKGLLPLLLAASCAATVPDDASRQIDRIAFGSCAFQWEPQPIWDAVLAADPNVFLFLGDAIYGDFDGKEPYTPTAETLRAEWSKLGAQPGFRELRTRVPVLATWDNHDYGSHDGGAEFALKEESKEIFLDFFDEPAGSDRRQTPGIHDARILGPVGRRVQVILLDTRTFKEPALQADRPADAKGSLGKYRPNPDPAVTLLGETQWSWLEAQLLEPAEVRLICSSTQVVADRKGMDEWGNYPHERRRLFELIESTGAKGVLFLSGNVHYAEISKTDAGPYPLFDFTSSGLTHTSAAYAEAPNPYRVSGPVAELNFGLVTVDWNATATPSITLDVYGLDRAPLIERVLKLDDLR